MRLGMDSLPQFAAVAIVFCVIGLVIGLWVSKRRTKPSDGEIVAQPKDLVEDEERDAKSILDEVRKLRTEFESRFGAKFSNFVFGPDDASAFFYAVSNSLERFNDDISGMGEDTDIDPVREAQGYVVIVQLILSWAQANGRDAIKVRAEEFLDAAKSMLEKAKAT